MGHAAEGGSKSSSQKGAWWPVTQLWFQSIYEKILYLLFICMRVNTHEPWCVSGGQKTTFGSHFFLSGGFQGSNQAIGFADEHRHLLRHLASFTQVCSGDPGAQERSRVHSEGRGCLSSTGAEGRLSFVDLTSCLSLCTASNPQGLLSSPSGRTWRGDRGLLALPFP